jgi:signal transduction histidine kinase
MATFIEQVFTLLASPQGNLIYHVVLAFSVFGALQASLYAWRKKGFPQGRRLVLGLCFLLLVQLLLFVGAGLAWQGIFEGHKLIPPLDRAIALFSLVLIIWLWAFPDPDRVADALTAFIGLIVLVVDVFGIIWWQGQDPSLYFNASLLSNFAVFLALGIILLGLIVLLVRRPVGWGFGLSMLLILAAGNLVQFFFPQSDSDFAWIIRLAEMASYPMLLALPQRLSLPAETRQPAEKPKPPEPRRINSDPKILQAFLNLAIETSPKKFYQDLTRLISQFLVADICLLVMPPNGGEQIIAPVGYDLVMDRVITGFAADGRQMPMLLSALRRGRPLRLPANSPAPDLQGMVNALGLKQAGHLLEVPISAQGQSPIMGIVLLSPYSNRGWSDEDQRYLNDAAGALASIMHRMQQYSHQQADLEQTREALQIAQADAEQVRLEREQMSTQLEKLSTQAGEDHSRVESLAGLVTSHENLQEMMVHLETRNKELEAMLAKGKPTDAEIKDLRQELRMALEEVARLTSTHTTPNQKELERQPSGLKSLEGLQQSEVVTSIAQEFRQPMSSIIGYTDLLLGESVGLLGAMQRKFLERIKASTERMGGLLDELVQITHIDGGQIDLTPDMVDLNAVIDEAVGNIIAQVSEKNIALRVDLPEELPPIQVNKDAMQQILSNLLQNAGAATPMDGEVSLHARVEKKENEPSYVLLSVSDQGGGISTEDMPRVFSRLYKADNPLIQGIGDTGVGLSIVKTLVEAHKGRIWVDTEPGKGSTFSILLPVYESEVSQANAAGAHA